LRPVFGLQAVREALRAHGAAVTRVWIARESGGKRDARLGGIERLAESLGVPVARAAAGELDRMAKGVRHQGVIAEAPELPVLDGPGLLGSLEGRASPLVLALDGVVDPQHFGALVRSAVAFGAAAVVWPEHASAPLSPAMVRASAGAVEHARLARVPSLPEVLRELAGRGFAVVLLEGRAEAALASVDLRGPCVLVVGGEEKGARRAVREAATAQARLPIAPTLDSLSAGAAGAAALYEVARQRASG
jgi:23S rRNA (guanosine2251-2'-O)-methyltransferase